MNVPSPGTRVGAHVAIGEALRQEEILRRRVVVEAIGAANHRFARSARIEGEADARREVVPVALVERVETLADADQPCGRNEIRDAIEFFRERSGVLVPQAEVQRQPAVDSPIVLQEQTDIVGVSVAASGAAGDAGAARARQLRPTGRPDC